MIASRAYLWMMNVNLFLWLAAVGSVFFEPGRQYANTFVVCGALYAAIIQAYVYYKGK